MTITLITGTSTGIGLQVAVQAAAAGHTVVATMRDLGKADALRSAASDAGVTVDIRQLDVTDAASIAACIEATVAAHGAIDALINNAGSGHLGTIEQEGLDAVRDVMEVNFFGVVATTRAAMPHLRASKGRVLTVSSVGGIVGQPFNEAYCAAKFAVEGFMEALAPVAATVGVRVSLVEPGAVSSDFVANVGADVPAMVAAAGAYGPALAGYIARTTAAFSPAAAQTPAGAAAAIVELLLAETPAVRIQTSDAARAFVARKLADLDGSAVFTETIGWVS
ncbi:SDR family NAD(P)-dependent oxidoreductase [Lacisediminihabitans profunda]|uniref:SDR family NAD(P)-dependent oxidoreductase n=1 Tax=Lacisediminihabitans profunda TaxID=2594790 RepID=A0A5C8US43_9MICO|nr:SDR family NAD(P)-dependent oxidoreductase [Lacisediminihabitans profunda]TXN30325.1 SDR family NAD(P)-dependent oxidoreductase [Lacisediminihabitans profunda]